MVTLEMRSRVLRFNELANVWVCVVTGNTVETVNSEMVIIPKTVFCFFNELNCNYVAFLW